MPLTKSLAQMQRLVENLASIRGQTGSTNASRHENDDVIEYINTSFGLYREMLTARKFDFFLTETAQAALPTSRADTDENYALIDWPASAVSVRRVDVLQRGEWKALTQVEWSRFRDVLPARKTATAPRYLYHSAKSQGEGGASHTTGKIAIGPFSTSSGVQKVTYLPAHTPITNTAHLFVFAQESGVMWVAWNTVAMITVRDRDVGKRHQPSLIERARCEELIGHSSASAIATGGLQMRRSPGYNG